MPWRECSIMSQRQEFVALASAQGAKVRALCRRFGISATTAYKWLARHRQGEALKDRSRRPQNSPGRTDGRLEREVLALRQQHPAWGGRKLRARLLAMDLKGVPAASTITEILRRHGCLSPSESIKHQPWQRFERSRPNELWQMDFKGHVPMHRGGRCHPLTVLDDHSRFAVALRACADERLETVREEFIAVFRRYGLPEQILSDNGPPWGTPGSARGYTRLTIWMLRLGVRVIHGRPEHPQTQGKAERFHRTLMAELLSRQDLRDLGEAQRTFDAWRRMYNLERPNEALGNAVPASRYQPSPRLYPERLPALAFGPDDLIRRVRPVRVPPPRIRDRRRTKGIPLVPVWVVRVWEPKPPGGVKAIEWTLVTSEPVHDQADARRVIDWYRARWLVEDYHKCLKSGCAVEDRQLETADRRKPLVAMLGITAVRLLQLKMAARQTPDRCAAEMVPEVYTTVLGLYRNESPDKYTCRSFWRGVAAMGGFLGRNTDGDPGWLTLWRGWQQVELLVIGARLGQTSLRRCGE